MKRFLRTATLALAGLAGVPAPAAAEFWSGNALYQALTGDDAAKAVAIGYLMGVHDTGRGVLQCTPDSVTPQQIVDLVKGFLEHAPQFRHLSADMIVVKLMATAWPCAAPAPTKRRDL